LVRACGGDYGAFRRLAEPDPSSSSGGGGSGSSGGAAGVVSMERWMLFLREGWEEVGRRDYRKADVWVEGLLRTVEAGCGILLRDAEREYEALHSPTPPLPLPPALRIRR